MLLLLRKGVTVNIDVMDTFSVDDNMDGGQDPQEYRATHWDRNGKRNERWAKRRGTTRDTGITRDTGTGRRRRRNHNRTRNPN